MRGTYDWRTRVHQATQEQQDCVFRILLYASRVSRHTMVYLRQLIDILNRPPV